MIPKATTKLYGLIGSPIDHSFSPSMHNTAFEEKGIDGCYLAFDTNKDTLVEVVEGLKSLGAVGWNVTMPLKTEIVKLCDELSPEAKMISAVNTVVNKDGKLKGYSTDGIGFFRNAKENGFDPKNKKIILIGAGGAARSIAAQAVLEDIKELSIFNRTLEKAEQLEKDIKDEAEKRGVKLKVTALEDQETLKKDIAEADLIINATSVGMNPDSTEIIFDPDYLNKNNIVADIVYTPNDTKLGVEAKKRGCKTLDGLGMVLWQGAYSFKYWTGEDFPVEIVKEKVFNA